MTKYTDEIKRLFKRVRTLLGAGVRSVELTDDSLCDLLDVAIEDYAEVVQNWLVETQWTSIWGKNVTKDDMAFALSTRTLDMTKNYGWWFSKEVGLQQSGPWELKKDFITIEKGKQVYVIPSGRTVNKVMWVNPPVTQAALFANYGGLDIGFCGGYGQIGGGAYGPIGGFYTAPAADVAYLSTDLTFKNRLLRSDLVYKITAGPNGTHLLHLMSTPGSKLSFGYMGGALGGLGLVGCEVWYTYYDTSNGNEDECIRENPDVVISPDQVPLSEVDYTLLNSPTKTIIRQLLVAKAKETLGLIRGKYSGKVSIPQAEMSLDYQMLIQQGKEEYESTMKNLRERLERMRPDKLMEIQANLIENNLKIQQKTPLGIYAI